MTESVKLGRRPVGPGGRAGLDDEDALPHQPRAGFDRVLAGLQRGGNRGSREFAADDAGGGEQFTVAVIEVIDLPVDEAAHVVRDRHDRAGRRRRRGCTCQLIDDADHEQGVASRPFEQQACDLMRLRQATSIAEPGGQVGLDGVEIERAQSDLVLRPWQPQLRRAASETGRDRRRIRHEGRQHHEAGGVGPARDMRKPVERGGIAQWISSSVSTRGASAAMVSTAEVSSRSIRSRAAPRASSARRLDLVHSEGIWASQLAHVARMVLIPAPSVEVPRRVKASIKGR